MTIEQLQLHHNDDITFTSVWHQMYSSDGAGAFVQPEISMNNLWFNVYGHVLQTETMCDGLIRLEDSGDQKCGPTINTFCGNQ